MSWKQPRDGRTPHADHGAGPIARTGRAAAGALLVLLAAVGCSNSATSPAGDVSLTLACSVITVSGGFGECAVTLTPLQSGTMTVETVTLIGGGGQPVGTNFRYAPGVGLAFYSDPIPSELAGRTFGPGTLQFTVRAVLSTAEGTTPPAPGDYPAAIRVAYRTAGGNRSTVELNVTIRVM
jgi:hypothetical protein